MGEQDKGEKSAV